MSGLIGFWPWALAAVALLAAVVVAALVLLLGRSARVLRFEDAEEEDEASAPAPMPPLSPPPAAATDDGGAAVGLRRAFRRARRHLHPALSGNRQAVPFYLLLGAEGSRDPDLLAGAGLDLPFGAPRQAGLDLGGGRGFWLFGRGAVLDLAGAAVLRADGVSADEHGWRTALHLLQRLRPGRPVDGVVLTLPCSELLAAGSRESALSELAMRATRLCRRLAGAQQTLGFRLPVYVLVTGGECLPGFASLGAALPSRLRGEMLGWSSPYVADAAYRHEWAADAVAALASRLDDLLLELFADGATAAGALLLLPDGVRSLRPVLETVLDQLFTASAYSESVLCRGVFLCGRESAEPAAAATTATTATAPAVGAAPPGRTIFLRDFLEAKVFPEAALAAPTARTLVARNRAVRIAQALTAAAALLFAGGLWWARSSLDHQRAVLRPFLGDTRLCLREVRHSQRGPDADLVTGSFRLLLKMKDIDFNRVGSVLVPSSWVSPFGRQIQQAITAAFNEVILTAIHLQLESKARALAELERPAERAAEAVDPEDLSLPGAMDEAGAAEVPPAEVLPVERMPEHAELKRYVGAARELERHGRAFNQLGESRDLRALGGVVEYALAQHLPAEFYQDAETYQKALGDARYQRFDPALYRAGASRAVEDRTAALYAALFVKSPLMARLDALARELQMMAWSRPAAGETASFAALARRLSELEAVLSGPDLEWAFGPQFDLGPGFAQVLSEMERCELFDPGTARRVRSSGAAGWAHFRRLLAARGSSMTGPILAVRSGKPEMQLSSDVVLLKTALETFLGQGFAAAPPPDRAPRVEAPAGMRLAWDGVLLGQAAAAAGAYERFRSRGLDLFPADLRAAIDEVARERTGAQLTDLIAGAQSYRPAAPAAGGGALLEEAIRSEVADFAAATPPVANLLDVLGRLQLADSQRQLARAMDGEASRLLRDVDRLLAAEQPYRPRQGGFSWWDGASSPTLAAWSARDAADVAGYLEATRARLAALARGQAQPLVSWLAKAEPDEPEQRELAAKWQGILDDLRDYEAKKPGNDLAALEEFAAVGMGKVRVQDCAAASAAGPRVGSGFFAASLRDLSRQLAGRCYALAAEQAAARYADVERYFNQRLAGRYPFAAGPPDGPGEPETQPEDLRSFFRLFDAGAPLVRSLPADGAAPAAGLGEVRRFLDAMGRVRAFFAPFLDAEKPEPVPAFDLEATFRTLREREVGGDQIIGWGLAVGDRTVTDRDKERKLRWKLGEPVRVSLRWASDGPRTPVVPVPRAGVSVADRTVSFGEIDRWALLAMLARRSVASAELPADADAEPTTLALSVSTRPAAGGRGVEDQARVFLRLEVFAPGTTRPLEVPSYFPRRAPRLDGKAKGARTAPEAAP